MKQWIMISVIFLSCSKYQFLVDNPYEILEYVDPEDILVFDQDCAKKYYKGNSIEVWGPHGKESNFQSRLMPSILMPFPWER